MKRLCEGLVTIGGIMAVLRLFGLDFFARGDVIGVGVMIFLIGILGRYFLQMRERHS